VYRGTSQDGSNAEEWWFRTDNFYPVKSSITASGTVTPFATIFTGWDSGMTISLPPPGKVKP
jgi:hypothetical protein